MGCDIHCYLEYTTDRKYGWVTFGGRINPGRNYTLFGRLAGVRTGEDPVFPVRGLPFDIASEADWDNRLRIVEIKDDERERECTRESAESWVKSGASTYILDREGTKAWVSDPDHHTHSWLTAHEFDLVLQTMPEEYEFSNMIEYKAVLVALQTLAGKTGEARLVFWFDN
jgi:hypothetical protein